MGLKHQAFFYSLFLSRLADQIILFLVPLVIFTSRRDVMGVHVNRRLTSAGAYAVTALITAMNAFLIIQQVI